MKFYGINIEWSEEYCEMHESVDGGYALRSDAEQAAKDAVWAAKLASVCAMYNHERQKAQAIIDKYEGGKS